MVLDDERTRNGEALRKRGRIRSIQEATIGNLWESQPALRFLFTRMYDSINCNKNKFLKPKDPREFYEILNFHMNIKSSGDYFE